MRFSPERSFRKELCNLCGTCETVCPSGAVSIEGDRVCFSSGPCIGCGHCGVYCPGNAFGLKPAADGSDAASPEALATLSRFRRSVRLYSSKIPAEEEIDRLLSILHNSPTGRNSQGVTVRVFRGEKAVSGLLAPVSRLLRILRWTGLPFVLGRLTGTLDFQRRLMRGEDLIFRGAPVVLFFFVPRRSITGRTDGVIAATTVMYHAVSLGMGTLWNGVAEKLYPMMGSWHSPSTGGMRLAAVLCAGFPLRDPLWEPPSREYSVILEDGTSSV